MPARNLGDPGRSAVTALSVENGRGGLLIHLIGDWNFRVVRGLGLIYRQAEAVTVTPKPARPRVRRIVIGSTSNSSRHAGSARNRRGINPLA
jgi:hypothetical protein